jgi:trans-2-enoyl-CoA reductase
LVKNISSSEWFEVGDYYNDDFICVKIRNWKVLVDDKYLGQNDLVIYGLIGNRKEFYNTRIVATCLMYKIEKRINKMPLIDEKELFLGKQKFAERCRSEEDIINENQEMLSLLIGKEDLVRWSGQVKII